MLAELNKLDKLVEQLQEQESGYLGEILGLMVSPRSCASSELQVQDCSCSIPILSSHFFRILTPGLKKAEMNIQMKMKRMKKLRKKKRRLNGEVLLMTLMSKMIGVQMAVMRKVII